MTSRTPNQPLSQVGEPKSPGGLTHVKRVVPRGGRRRAASPRIVRRSRGTYCFLLFEDTHLPKADAALPPYLAVNAVRSTARSALQTLAALIVAASCWALAVLAFEDTHLP